MACANQLRTKIHAERSSNGLCEPASDKNRKKQKKKERKKRPQRGTPRDGSKIEFFEQNVKSNRNEIEA